MEDIFRNDDYYDPPDEPEYPRCPECDDEMYKDGCLMDIRGLEPGWACHNPCCTECSIDYREEINDIYLDDDEEL